MSGGGKALVMDDEEMIREVAGELLALSGYEVEFAVNGEKAIEAYKNAKDAQRPFDLVILDLTVPGGIGGREAIGVLLQIDPGVKAIVSSGHSNDPVVSDYRRYGFRGVILKPYNVTNFVAEVRRVMGAP
ncbi:MAG: response regulator [Deltaproteobacteria bacterium]|nr:response regulator [Deltaproteobacteria bacterium]